LSAYESEVNARSMLTGRNLEPWRAVLAVALWLDSEGVTGLWQRMETLSVAYQSERIDLEPGDLTALVIRGLCRYATHAVSAVNRETPKTITFKTKQIVEITSAISSEIEADINPEFITSRSVGRVLGKMRLKPDRTAKSKGWAISYSDLAQWAKSYGLPWPDNFEATLLPNGTNGTDGITAQPDLDREVVEI
jgi:hypothetical protein